MKIFTVALFAGILNSSLASMKFTDFPRVAAQVTAKQAFNNDGLRLEANNYCTNPNSIDEGKYGIINEWDVSQVTSMEYLFRGFVFSSCNPPIQDWNVTNVQNFGDMFLMAYTFNQDISQWDVSRGTYFGFMFSGAQSFNQNISQWDVSRGTTFGFMFSGAQSFNQDISQWDVSQGTNFENMFKGAISFDQDLSQWPQEARDSCINGAHCTAKPTTQPTTQPTSPSSSPTAQPSAKPSSSLTKISGVSCLLPHYVNILKAQFIYRD